MYLYDPCQTLAGLSCSEYHYSLASRFAQLKIRPLGHPKNAHYLGAALQDVLSIKKREISGGYIPTLIDAVTAPYGLQQQTISGGCVLGLGSISLESFSQSRHIKIGRLNGRFE